VSDEIPIAPLIYDGLDPAPKPKPVVSEVLDVLGGSVQHSQSQINAEGGAVLEPVWNLKFRHRWSILLTPPIKFHLFPMRPLPPHGLEWEGRGPLGRGWAGKPKIV